MSEWVKTAKVGDKVMCIKDDPRTDRSDSARITFPVKGRVYTIRQVLVGLIKGDPVPAFLLDEITHPMAEYKTPDGVRLAEICFDARRFGPIQMRQTDISIFQRLLHTAPSELEDA